MASIQENCSWKYPLPLNNYIHGKWQKDVGKNFLTVYSAVDDSIVTEELVSATSDDIDAAVQSAEDALSIWQSMSVGQRREILNKFADLIEENADILSYLDTVVTGKPISMGLHLEVPTLAESFRYYAGYIDKENGDLSLAEDGFLRGVIYQPLGVCAAIVPFNSPLITFGMKVAPAIATGNAIIVKPSEYNPFGTLYLGELASKAGIPDGLINIINGAGDVGIALSHHSRIRKISFTGSPAIGRLIQKAAAESNLKRVTLELGGKSPVLIFQDADVNNAVQHAMAYLAFNGQGCCLGTRLMVEKPIAAQFVALLKEKTEAYASTLGVDPMSATTISGPLFHRKQRDAVLKFLEHGQKTATLVTGGCAWGEKGCYIQPTIFLEPHADSKIHKEEIFGPVVTVETFETEKEAIALANDTEYGLAGYVFTGSIDRSLRVSKALEVGTVSVNTAILTHITLPFGGWKGSGIGAENSKEVLRAYTQPKSIAIQYIHSQ